MTRASKARRIDVQRLGEALGLADLTYAATARIETPPDAVTFEAQHGWIVDVAFYGGPLEGETEVPCRVLSTGPGGDGFGEYMPPEQGAEVLVAVPDGEVEANPVVLGYLTNMADAKPPTEINGLPIVADALVSTLLAVSPFDTEFKRSPHSRREQYGGEHWTQATRHVVKADQAQSGVLLGSELAAKSFLLGEDMVSKLIAIVDQLLVLLQTGAIGASPVVFAGLPAFQTFWSTPVTGLKAQLQQPGVVLSLKIKGE